MYSLTIALRRIRKQYGWTQQHLAGQLHISIPAYSKIESGVTDVNYSRIAQIAEFYGLSVIELLAYGSPDYETLLKMEIKIISKQLNVRAEEIDFLQQKLDRLNVDLKQIRMKDK